MLARSRAGHPGLVLLLAFFALPSAAAELGRVHFPTSGSPAAQERFLEGVLWLHSFEYDNAREAFVEARKLEPGFVMAAWGEAMSYNYPIWMNQDVEEARRALERLAPSREERLARAATERERRYLEAVEILFGGGEGESGEASKAERDRAYAEAMGRLAEDYPEDLEAASFYALALLGTCHEGRDVATHMRAAAVAEEVFAANPRHPGAAHYLIHSYDDPVHAPLGLRPAREYAGIAPAAEHALHMPSHIFLALGLWDETAASNEASWQAAEERVARKQQSSDRRGYHALLWLHYAYLQQGRFREAGELLALIEKDVAGNGSSRTRSHYARMRSQQLVETRAWGELRPAPDLDGVEPHVAAADHFTTGYAALHRGELEAAERALVAIGELQNSLDEEEARREVAVELVRLQLRGLLSLARGRSEEGLELLRQAADQEEKTPFGFGPPLPVKPSHELLAESLADLGRHREAAASFELALERTPRRALALAGLAKVRCSEGEEAGEVLADLADVRRRSDETARGRVAECGVIAGTTPAAGGAGAESN